MRSDPKAARQKPQYQIRPDDVIEPEMTAEDRSDFQRGVDLFNREEYWESHEAWELIWRRHTEASRIFFQGLIQLAAAYHQLRRNIFHGVIKHFNNAQLKLEPFMEEFLGVPVEQLVKAIRKGRAEAERLGEGELGKFDPALIPKIELRS